MAEAGAPRVDRAAHRRRPPAAIPAPRVDGERPQSAARVLERVGESCVALQPAATHTFGGLARERALAIVHQRVAHELEHTIGRAACAVTVHDQPYHPDMAVLADAALDEAERVVLERFVAAVIDDYGDDLDGVWLYGSRARGERPHDESDVDVLVITRDERDDTAIYAIQHRVLNELGNPRVLLEPRQRSRGWIEDRRAIESFFLQEVDKDKIVLYGRS